MSFAALVAMLNRPEGSAGQTTVNAAAPETDRFADLLSADDGAAGPLPEELGATFEDIGRDLADGRIETRPAAAVFAELAADAASDAPSSGDALPIPEAMVVVLADPAASPAARTVHGALTGAFVEGGDVRAVPVMHVDAAEPGRVLDAFLAGAALDSVDAAPPGLPALEAAVPLEIAGQDLSRDDTLLFVPMRAWATGHMDMRLVSGVDAAGTTAGSTGRAAIRSDIGQVNPTPATIARANAAAPRFVAAEQGMPQPALPSAVPARRAADSATASHRRDFYELIQGVLPPRQSFLVLEAGAERRLYIRDYFSPGLTLRQLGRIAAESPFDLRGLNVVINGIDHGRVG